MKAVNVILFNNFTTLDALGPAEVLSHLKDYYETKYYSLTGGMISSSIGARIFTEQIQSINKNDVLLVPGGFGTRELVKDQPFLDIIRSLSDKSEVVLSICTGSALLAKAGVLKNKNATSNKLSWDWVIAQDKDVKWIRKARWVVDGKFYTSSGVTAGIDMTLGYVADQFNYEIAERISISLEYIWNENKEHDPFA